MDAVWAGIARLSARDDAKRGKVPESPIRQAGAQLAEVHNGLLNRLFSTKFDFNADPRAVAPLNDGINLKPRGIAIVKDSGVHDVGIYPQIPDNHGFEQQAHRIEIFQQTVGRNPERGGGQRGVDEMPFGLNPSLDA